MLPMWTRCEPMVERAWKMVGNACSLSSSSWKRSLKLSMLAFCIGRPSSMKYQLDVAFSTPT